MNTLPKLEQNDYRSFLLSIVELNIVAFSVTGSDKKIENLFEKVIWNFCVIRPYFILSALV